MIGVALQVQRINEPTPIVPEDLPIHQTVLEKVAILEGGMQSGKTSMMLVFTDGEKRYFAETSAELFRGFCAALNGAEQRFIEQKNPYLSKSDTGENAFNKPDAG